MRPPTDDAALAARLAAAGLVVPEDLRAGVLAGCRQLVAMTTLLRGVALEPEDEPLGAAHFAWEADGDGAA